MNTRICYECFDEIKLDYLNIHVDYFNQQSIEMKVEGAKKENLNTSKSSN